MKVYRNILTDSSETRQIASQHTTSTQIFLFIFYSFTGKAYVMIPLADYFQLTRIKL